MSMTHHIKYEEAKTLIKENIPVLLTGEKGSGKTTMAKQIAEELGLKFFSVSLTRQTTLSYLLGFMNVNGVYIPSLLRGAVEHGGMYLLDELDAGDPNVLLSLNTIENGFVSFPDGIIECHENFRLVATSNPQDEHSHYTGRAKLDGATLDRFDIIEVPRDEMLEKTLVDADTFRHVSALREVLREHNSSTIVSMRDSMRFQKRKELGLTEGFVHRLVGNNELVIEKYNKFLENMPKHTDQSECKTLEELVSLVSIQSNTPEFKNYSPKTWTNNYTTGDSTESDQAADTTSSSQSSVHLRLKQLFGDEYERVKVNHQVITKEGRDFSELHIAGQSHKNPSTWWEIPITQENYIPANNFPANQETIFDFTKED